MIRELQKQYADIVVPMLKEKFGYKNSMETPKLVKVVINVGYGKQTKDKNFIEHVEQTLSAITGQKPVHNKARKSISNFKIRAGMPVGASVTLRGTSMYNFVYKFINLTLPRVRDFRGLNVKSIDKQGNYTVGLKENIAFPEITPSMADVIHGLEIVIDTSAKSPEEGLALLEGLGFPFKK